MDITVSWLAYSQSPGMENNQASRFRVLDI